MIVDLVCPLGTGSRWGNLELAFALRSVQKHLSYTGDLFIVGENVPWLIDAHQLSFPDLTHVKEQNIYWKIRHACENPLISDPFLFINDDLYINESHKAYEYPFYYSHDLNWVLEKRKVKDAYYHALSNTIHALTVQKRLQLHFDVHTPLLIHKKWFIRIMDLFEWKRVQYGFVIKSLYMNMWEVPGSPRWKPDLIEITDFKSSSPPPDTIGKQVISSGSAHHKKREWLNFLKAQYPVPSRWEGHNFRLP